MRTPMCSATCCAMRSSSASPPSWTCSPMHRPRAGQNAGKADARADMFSAGILVTAPGGHGTEYGMTIPTITSPDSAQAFVDARLAEGSDWIKIVYDDGRAYGMSTPT